MNLTSFQETVRRLFSADDAFVRKNEEIEMVATSATINIDGDEKSVTGASLSCVQSGAITAGWRYQSLKKS